MSVESRLGFAVPAYRRPQLLDIALASIVPQAREIGAPIYVPDNACDDTNVAVMRKWQDDYPLVRHEINGENIGIDRNVHQAICRCPADYVHVIGDDDVIYPGFARRVLDVIETFEPGHVVCSYLYLSNDYRPISGKSIIPAIQPDLTMRRLLPRHGSALGFIGAHVFCRERFASSLAEGFGTYFHHLARLLSYLSPDEPIGFVEQPLVGNRADDESTPTWSGDRLAVVYGLEKVLASAMSTRYSEQEIRDTVDETRRVFGYTQFFRLLYWAALAERGGQGEQYWGSLARVVPGARYAQLRAFPRILYAPLLELIPLARRAKRRLHAADGSIHR